MWSVVHVCIDLRPSALALDDLLFHLVPHDPRWYWVTDDVYTWITVSALAALVLRSARGDHRPLLIWGIAL
jgi:hypothetical protein